MNGGEKKVPGKVRTNKSKRGGALTGSSSQVCESFTPEGVGNRTGRFILGMEAATIVG